MDEAILNETERLWQITEADGPKNGEISIPNVVLDDAPGTELLIKAHNIFAGQNWENLDALACRIADDALYAAKHQGRNRVVYYPEPVATIVSSK